jgi:hypothetical protein
MLFVRTYIPRYLPPYVTFDGRLSPASQDVQRQIEEDVERNYSFHDGEYEPTLPQDSSIRRGSDEARTLFLSKDFLSEDLESSGRPFQRDPLLSRGGVLLGLCAICRAEA